MLVEKCYFVIYILGALLLIIEYSKYLVQQRVDFTDMIYRCIAYFLN